MGNKGMIVCLTVVFSFCCPASLFPLAKTLPSAHLQENNVKDEVMNENTITSSTFGGKHGILHRSNIAHGNGGGRGYGGGRTTGGHSAGTGENGNGDGSKSPNVPGGTAVIPLYTAGAAGSHHHSAGSCNRSCIGLPTFCAAILASLLVHVCVVFRCENFVK